MKKVLKILTLVMLIITIIKIGDTYSRYYTSANTSDLSKDIGEWIIKVNEKDIYSENGQTLEFTLNNFSNFTNPNADPTKISPGNKGYTDIVIDPSGTDVAVRYDIEFNESIIFELQNMFGININLELQTPTENMQFVKISNSKYSGTISLEDIQENQKATIRYYVEWINTEEEYRNEMDTLMGTQGKDALIGIPINVTVTQYLGEPLQ